MTKFAFFASKEDRWEGNMRALWGNLSICPRLDYLELPYCTSEELLSVALKSGGTLRHPIMIWPIS